MKPLLAITMGDVAGIGPEIIVKALARPAVYDRCRPLVIGDADILKRDLQFAPAGVGPLQVQRIQHPQEGSYTWGTLDIIQPGEARRSVEPGKLSAVAGAGSVEFVRAAAALAQAGEVDAIVTAPLNKEAMHMAGFHYPGHTELLAEFFGVDRYSLVLTARHLHVFHVTTHMSLRQAIEHVTQERVLAIIELAHHFANALGMPDERIAVLGLNPHAGEGGIFGDEERMQIAPAIQAAREQGIPVDGPLPGDTLFPKAVKGAYKFVIAMYHDQGHMPFKSVYFDEGVNIMVGLPVIRTSVDHGTAFDIAGKGVAHEESLIAALDLAIKLAPEWQAIWQKMELVA